MASPESGQKVKRDWCYAQLPAAYAVAPCECGNADIQWSEWKGHCWCAKCEIDFIPTHNGVFDGPIPLGAAHLFGVRFDRINLLTNLLEREEDYMAAPSA